ncbi:hypothetical protein [Butyrivibrio sp. MB2005]|uniref:hypothetical protein n=1 Tax=Butyrivibrio sp. MB2005 TaxID=1280678 RepID=UPI0003F706B0|nr:hypothetical protein [Butyrivibrio sp. MB2005]
MAVTKVIKIDDKDVTFKASAATPRIYRNLFGRDIFKDLSKLEKDIDKSGEEDLDMFSLEMFENLAFVFARQGEPEKTPHTPDEWLDQFSTFSIYEILPELISLWGMNIQQQVESKKNFQRVIEK